MGAIVPRESRGSTRANTVENTIHNAESSADAIYNAYPNQGPGFYRYIERNSSRRNLLPLVVPAGSRRTETVGRRRHAPYSGVPGGAITA